jgi:hypothetical protein
MCHSLRNRAVECCWFVTCDTCWWSVAGSLPLTMLMLQSLLPIHQPCAVCKRFCCIRLFGLILNVKIMYGTAFGCQRFDVRPSYTIIILPLPLSELCPLCSFWFFSVFILLFSLSCLTFHTEPLIFPSVLSV